MSIAAIDHWVLVVKDLEETFAFYRRLGLDAGWQERPGGGKRPIVRISETQKLNLYVVDRYTTESPTHAPNYATGNADFCLRWEGTVAGSPGLPGAGRALPSSPVPWHAPVPKASARAFTVRDPDDNLIELMTYGDPAYA